MTYSYRTMVRRAVGIPLVDKLPCPDREPVSAVSIADLKYGSGHRLRLGYQKEYFSVYCLDHRKQRYRAKLHRHFHGQPVAYFTMIYLKRAHFDLSFSNGKVTRSVVPHQHNIIIKIHRIIFGKGP